MIVGRSCAFLPYAGMLTILVSAAPCTLYLNVGMMSAKPIVVVPLTFLDIHRLLFFLMLMLTCPQMNDYPKLKIVLLGVLSALALIGGD